MTKNKTKKTYSLSVDNAEVIDFINHIAQEYCQPKCRVLLMGLYALMRSDGISPQEENGCEEKGRVSLKEVQELKARIKRLEAQLEEYQLDNLANGYSVEMSELAGLYKSKNDGQWDLTFPPF